MNVRDPAPAQASGLALDRRRFLLGSAGAMTALSVGAGLTRVASANAAPGVVSLPNPIPGGLPIGLPPPYDTIHIFLPGPTSVTLPFSGLTLQGLDVEPITVTDFRGETAMAYLVGTVEGSDGHRYGLELDLRVSQGEYVAVNGARSEGLFAMI